MLSIFAASSSLMQPVSYALKLAAVNQLAEFNVRIKYNRSKVGVFPVLPFSPENLPASPHVRVNSAL
jgi:hypothetical protein